MIDENYFKIYINDTEVICVSRLGYSGSRNLHNVQSILFDHHVTFVAVYGQRQMTEMVGLIPCKSKKPHGFQIGWPLKSVWPLDINI